MCLEKRKADEGRYANFREQCCHLLGGIMKAGLKMLILSQWRLFDCGNVMPTWAADVGKQTLQSKAAATVFAFF